MKSAYWLFVLAAASVLPGCYDFGALSSQYEGGTAATAGEDMSPRNQDCVPPIRDGSQDGSIDAGVTNSADMADCPDGNMVAMPDMSSQVPRDGLVGEWLFSGGIGVALDTSNNANHGKVYGATPTADRHGKANSAYYFNGKSYIEVADSKVLGLTNNFSISVWVNIAAYGSSRQGILSKYQSNGHTGYDLRITGNVDPYDTLDMDEAAFHIIDGAAVPPTVGTWHHIGTVVSAGTVSVYVDGVLLYTGLPGYPAQISPDPLDIGVDYKIVSPRFFNGSIDDVRIYGRVLSPDEINTLAHEG